MISRMFDAAFPPVSAPADVQAVLGYVGREGFTPHVWTLAEWQQFQHLVQIPCWVPDLSASAIVEAAAAVQAVLNLGWAPHMKYARIIVFDFETASGSAIRGWWQNCAATLTASGFEGVMYGSLDTVLENAASDVLIADWDGSDQLLPGQTIHGHQYQAGVDFGGTQIDYSVIDEWLFARAGQGPRHR